MTEINLILNLDEALLRCKYSNRKTLALYSFIDFCKNQVFKCSEMPKAGETLLLDTVFEMWSLEHKDYRAQFELIRTLVFEEIEIIHVIPGGIMTAVYCSDEIPKD